MMMTAAAAPPVVLQQLPAATISGGDHRHLGSLRGLSRGGGANVDAHDQNDHYGGNSFDYYTPPSGSSTDDVPYEGYGYGNNNYPSYPYQEPRPSSPQHSKGAVPPGDLDYGFMIWYVMLLLVCILPVGCACWRHRRDEQLMDEERLVQMRHMERATSVILERRLERRNHRDCMEQLRLLLLNTKLQSCTMVRTFVTQV